MPSTPSLDRRSVLRLAGAAAAMSWLPRAAFSQPRWSFDPFGLGVASGSPADTSVVLWTTAQLLARRLSTTESSHTILFYYAAVGTLLMGVILPFVWVAPTPIEWAAMAAVGVLGCMGQYLLVLAFRFAPLSLVAPFEYSALIWASLYGWLFWGERVPPSVWWGGTFILGGLAVRYLLQRPGSMVVYRDSD